MNGSKNITHYVPKCGMKRQLNLYKHHNKGLNLIFNASAHYIPLERDFWFWVRFFLKFPDHNFSFFLFSLSFRPCCCFAFSSISMEFISINQNSLFYLNVDWNETIAFVFLFFFFPLFWNYFVVVFIYLFFLLFSHTSLHTNIRTQFFLLLSLIAFLSFCYLALT